MKIVVDASVVAQRLVVETDTPKARQLLLDWLEGKVELLAPELMAVEIGNMLWKRVFRNLLPADKAFELYREFSELQIPLSPCEPLMQAAFQLSVTRQHPVYDCLYVILASETECELLTADEKMYRTFKPVLDTIHLLRDWSW